MYPITNHPAVPDNTFSGICPCCVSINNLNSQPHEHISNMSDLENDILEMEAKIDSLVHNFNSINHHMDFLHLSSPSTKKSYFWSTSTWTKKWQHWKRRHNKTTNETVSSTKLAASSHDMDTGRRSCDMGPRFSLDAGSWDGYLVGRSFPKLGDENIPGGETQTREYYLNSSSRRRKGVERSNSVVADNSGSVSNAKVSPAASEYYNNIHKQRRIKFHSIGGEKELAGDDGLVKKPRWWNWKVKVFGNHIISKNDRKLSRSNSSISWRNMVEKDNKCQRDEFVSDNHASNGLLRFYLTPLRGSKRGATATGSSKNKISSKG